MSAELYIEAAATSSKRKGMFVKFLAFIVVISVVATLVFLLKLNNYPTIPDNLEFISTDGSRQQFIDFRGKPLLLAFWSPSCMICMQEVDSFNQLYQEHGDKRFELAALSMYSDRPDQVVRTQQEKGMNYPVYLDLHNHISTAFGNIIGTPTSFLIDADGEIIEHHMGALNFEEMNLKLIELSE